MGGGSLDKHRRLGAPCCVHRYVSGHLKCEHSITELRCLNGSQFQVQLPLGFGSGILTTVCFFKIFFLSTQLSLAECHGQSYLRGPTLRVEPKEDSSSMFMHKPHLRTKREAIICSQSFHFCAVLLYVPLMERKHLPVRYIDSSSRAVSQIENTVWM